MTHKLVVCACKLELRVLVVFRWLNAVSSTIRTESTGFKKIRAAKQLINGRLITKCFSSHQYIAPSHLYPSTGSMHTIIHFLQPRPGAARSWRKRKIKGEI